MRLSLTHPARLLWALGLASLTGVAYAQSGGEIKIGLPSPMTGPNTMYGDQIQAGVLTAIETINAAGGVNGKPLVPVLVDDACEPKQAVPSANRVINEGAKFAVGHACSSVAIPAVNVYESEGIVVITPGATSPLVTDTTRPHYFFRTIGRDDQQGPFSAEFIAREIKPARVAIVHDKLAYGAGVASQVRDTLAARGINIVAYEGINAGEGDYSALITKLKAANIDFLYYGGYYPEMGLLLRQAREQGLTARIMGPEGINSTDLVAIAGAGVEGLLMSMPTDFTQRPGNEAVVKAFWDAKRDPVGVFQMSAYAGVQILAASIEAVGEDADKVADYMHANRFDTVIGPVEFDAKGDLKDFGYIILEWNKDGKTRQL